MPKPAITRVSNFQVYDGDTKNKGFCPPQLTQTEINAIPANILANNTIVFNTTAKVFQMYQTYVTAAANATTSAWVTLSSIPMMTSAEGAFYENTVTTPGAMYIQSNTNIVRVFIGAWRSIATA